MLDACPLSYPAIGLPQYHMLMYIIIPCLISLLIILVNIVLIYTMYKTGQYNTVSNKLLILLSASDLVTGIFLPPYYAFIAYEIESCGLKKTVEIIWLISLYFSFNISCCITVDRYLHIKKSTRYQEIMTNFRLIIVIGAAFFIATINIIALTILPSFLIVLFSCLLSICSIVIMAILNWLMKRSLKSHNTKMESRFSYASNATADQSVIGTKSVNTGVNFQQNEPVKRQFQAVKTIKYLLISLAILFVPIDFINVVFAYIYFVSKSFPPLGVRFGVYFAALMFISNSWVNALIIASGNKRCKTYISSHFLPRFCCKRPNRVSVHEAKSSNMINSQRSQLNVLELPRVA